VGFYESNPYIGIFDLLRRLLSVTRGRVTPQYELSFADDLDDQIAGAGTVVEVDEDDLLPGAEEHFAIGEGDGQGRPLQGGADVGGTVAVAPGQVVVVGFVRRGEFFVGFREVLEQTRFEFNGGDAAGGAAVENGDLAFGKAVFIDNGGDFTGDVDDVGVAASGDGEVIGDDFHGEDVIYKGKDVI